MITKLIIKKNILFLLFLILVIINTFSYAGGPGSTSAAFLKIGVGARPAGMGGAFTAVANDVNSIFWNPAGLLSINNNEFIFMHNDWFENINYEYIGYAHKLNKNVIGIGVSYVNLGNIDVTQINGLSPVTNLGTTDAKDMLLIFSYAKKFIKKINTGINFKYINETIESKSADAFAFDIGTNISLINKKWMCALVLQNIGSKIKFINKSYSLPAALKIGTAYKLDNIDLTLSIDICKPNDNTWTTNIGGEYLYKNFYFRAGYSSINDAGSGLTGGTGFRFLKYKLDYAYVPYGDLGSSHRISFNINFSSK